VVVVVGNMNVGKSTLFRRMCEKTAIPVVMPDSTVTAKMARIRHTGLTAVLSPGILSLFSSNEDETVTRNILLDPRFFDSLHGILLVADAKNMKRSLAIALQYAEYGRPMLMALNMTDEAAARGIEIRHRKLAALLNLDVRPTMAREGMGVRELVAALPEMRTPPPQVLYPEWIESYLAEIRLVLGASPVSPRALGLLLMAGDRAAAAHVERKFGPATAARVEEIVARHRREDEEGFRLLVSRLYHQKAEAIAREVIVEEPRGRQPFLARFGDWCTRLPSGIAIAAGVLAALYFFVGSFGATFLVDTINGTLFQGLLIPRVTGLIEPLPSQFLKDLIVDPDFGILPTGVFLALGLVLPVLFCFYIAFGALEESGYLPRLSILLDKVFQRMGLNGKGVIPLVMGFSCVTMAILTTRLLDTNKEKNIATFLLLLGMPCAPLIAVMLVILEKMPASATVTVFAIILSQTFLAGVVANKILPGQGTPLLMEIPPMRWPRPLHVLRMATRKTYFFMKEAIPVFILASLAVFLFERLGGLAMLERVARPLTGTLLGLPEQSVQVFIKTIIRRESGGAELEHLSAMYSNLQLVINLLVMTFLAPCVNSMIVLFKERGFRVTATIIVTVMIYAVILGAVVNHVCRFLGVTFAA